MATILSLGCDSQLLELRSAILRNAGYVVVERNGPSPKLTAWPKVPPDLVLICHTISKERQSALLSAVREFTPRIPVVVLDGEYSNVCADATPFATDNPAEMLKVIAELLSRARPTV